MTDAPAPRPVARFFGGLLMAVGGLIAVTAGLCSLAITGMGLFAPAAGPQDFIESLPMVLIAGGGPFVVGLLLFLGGRVLFRGSPPGQWPPPNPGPGPDTHDG